MLKLTINSNDWRQAVEFEISYIQYEMDDSGIPVDIVVVGKEETLEAISDFARIGCNMQPITEWAYQHVNIHALMLKEEATHEMLIARLLHFEVKGDCRVIYQPLNI